MAGWQLLLILVPILCAVAAYDDPIALWQDSFEKNGCVDLSPKSTVNSEPVMNSILHFNQGLLETILRSTDKNILLSPLSLYDAITLIAMGSRGSTLEQTEKALNIKIDSPAWHEGMEKLQSEIVASGNETNEQTASKRMSIQLLGAAALSVSPEYWKNVTRVFRAVRREENPDDPQGAPPRLYEFKGNITNRLTKDASSEGSTPALTKLIVSNAHSIKGEFSHKFSPLKIDRNFLTDENKLVRFSSIFTYGDFKAAYFCDLDAKALFLPLKDNRHGLILILPSIRSSLDKLELQLQASSLTPKSFLDRMSYRPVLVNIPAEFKIRSKMKVNDILTESGITDLFEADANLSGISRDLSIETGKMVDIYDESIIEIGQNQDGTNATQFDTMEQSETGSEFYIYWTPEVPVFDFETTRPFLYYVVDLENDSIPLFAGRIVEPYAGP